MAQEWPKLMRLTAKQRAYVLAFASLGFQYKLHAAEQAGYKKVRKAVYDLDHHHYVQEAIEEQKQAAEKSLEERWGPLRDRVMAELAELAFRETNSLQHLATWDVDGLRPKSPEELKAEVLGTIRKVKQGKDGVELEAYDRGQNLERLARVLGMMKTDDASPQQVQLVIHGP